MENQQTSTRLVRGRLGNHYLEKRFTEYMGSKGGTTFRETGLKESHQKGTSPTATTIEA